MIWQGKNFIIIFNPLNHYASFAAIPLFIAFALYRALNVLNLSCTSSLEYTLISLWLFRIRVLTNRNYRCQLVLINGGELTNSRITSNVYNMKDVYENRFVIFILLLIKSITVFLNILYSTKLPTNFVSQNCVL